MSKSVVFLTHRAARDEEAVAGAQAIESFLPEPPQEQEREVSKAITEGDAQEKSFGVPDRQR